MKDNWKVVKVEGVDVKEFVVANHYLGVMCRGAMYNFALFEGSRLIGAACFGEPVGAGVKRQWGDGTIELKRFVLKPNLPKNSATWFLSRCLKQLNGLAEQCISYADPEQGHEGTIYKAANFDYLGTQSSRTPYVVYNGKVIYSRNVYSDTEQGAVIRQAIKDKKIKTQFKQPKHIFMYDLKRG